MFSRSLAFFLLFQVVSLRSQTFSSTVNQPIPDDGTVVSFELQVSGLPAQIDTFYGLEQVCLNLNHTYDEDMNVKLQSPSGQTILLFGGVGGGEDNFVNTCLAGEGLDFSQSPAPFSGTFQSFGILGNFNKGQNPNGVWKLAGINSTFGSTAFISASPRSQYASKSAGRGFVP